MSEPTSLHAAYEERYRIVTNPVMLRMERAVIGGEFGASSYTTMEQADRLASSLGLGSGDVVLDLGSGSGWPGSYIAQSTGCHVVLVDPAWEGMAVAAERSRADGLATSMVVATGAELPLSESSFDAAISSDVFC